MSILATRVRTTVACVAAAVVDAGHSGPREGTVRMSRPDLVYIEYDDTLVVAVERDSAPRTPNGVYVGRGVDLSAWTIGSVVRLERGALVGPDLVLAWSDESPVYAGEIVPLGVSADHLAQALGVRQDADCPVCAVVGMHPLWSRPPTLAALHALARRSPARPFAAEQLALLLGLGPGLTPESDDLLVGVVLAQRACGIVVDDALGDDELTRRVPGATTSLSGTWLRLAARGRAVEPLHMLLSVAPGSTAWQSAIDGLRAVGSSTGRAMLAGATLGVVGAAHESAIERCDHEAGARCRG